MQCKWSGWHLLKIGASNYCREQVVPGVRLRQAGLHVAARRLLTIVDYIHVNV